jgi:hypothetical protein
MYLFYAIGLLFFAIGGIVWHKTHKVTWWEWLVGGGVSLLMSGLFHWQAFRSMTDDIETLSGYVTEARHIPAWTEQYTYTVTHSSGSGKTRRTWTTTHTGTAYHAETWTVEVTVGSSMTISEAKYQDLVQKFGPADRVEGVRRTSRTNSHMTAGDPLDDVSSPRGYIEPVTTQHHWTNRVKACPSVWSFPQPPEKAPVYDYPTNADCWASERLLGTANALPLYEWDQMNARIGEAKQVNVIACGFGPSDASVAQLQRAKWIGGKKNDVVICWGGASGDKAEWVEVFGWTESELCKANLRTIVLEHPINKALIPLIEAEIRANYQIKDWTKFDYLSIEPPPSAYWIFFIVLLVVQGGLYIYFYCNEHEEDR